MILKILHSDGNSWWLYDNLEKVRFCRRGGDFVLISGKIDDSSDGDALYNFGVFHASEIDKNDITQTSYRWARDNLSEFVPDVTILDFDELNQEGVNFVSWVLARNGDEEKFIVFNTLGFLLNDDGKTIEKIIC